MNNMKPILNKEMVLEFAREAKKKTDELPSETSQELAVAVGRMQIISELMDLVLSTI